MRACDADLEWLAMEALVDPMAVPDELLGEMLELLYAGLALRASEQQTPGR